MKDNKIKKAFVYVNETSNLFTVIYGKKIGRSLNLTGAAVTASLFLVIGKLAMGILSLSLFTCVNAFYSFGMIGAKIIALIGIRKAQNESEKYKYYVASGAVLILSSLLYIVYSIRLFFRPITSSYHEYLAIGIAAVTFTEIGLNIRGVIITRYNHTLLIHAIKMINLSASLIALVLTQTALLSFTNVEADHLEISKSNGVIGVIIGAVATAIGAYMICRANKMKIQENL